MSQSDRNGHGNDRRDGGNGYGDEPIAVRIAKEIVGALQVRPKSVEGVESITAWPLLTAVVAVGVAKCDAIRKTVLLGFITEHNAEGTPAAEVFATIELAGNMRSRDILVRIAAATVATMIFDEMRLRLGERAGDNQGEGRPGLRAVDGDRAAG